MFQNFRIFLLISSVLALTSTQFDKCDFEVQIPFVARSVVVKNPGNTCRHLIVAPVNTIIQATCSFTLPNVSSIRISRKIDHLVFNRVNAETLKYFFHEAETNSSGMGNFSADVAHTTKEALAVKSQWHLLLLQESVLNTSALSDPSPFQIQTAIAVGNHDLELLEGHWLA